MKHQKTGVIVQARMGSTRLPGKILKELDENVKVLDVLIKRLKISKNVDEIIIATTPDVKNKSIIEVVNNHMISYFVGSEEDVLKRYYQAAEKFNIDIVIRVTSDCPFVDPQVLDDMILLYKNNKYDYIRNVHESTNFSRGFEIEILSFKVLKKIYSLAKTTAEREHVTYFIDTHPEMFNIFNYNIDNLKKLDNLRLTIDEKDDLIICREIYKRLKKKGKSIDFSVFDIVEIIEENPELMDLNKHIQQKEV